MRRPICGAICSVFEPNLPLPRLSIALRQPDAAGAVGFDFSDITILTEELTMGGDKGSGGKGFGGKSRGFIFAFACLAVPVSYTHLRAHETVLDLVCRLLLEK